MHTSRPSTIADLPPWRADPPQRARQPVCIDQIYRVRAEAGIEPSVGSVGDSYDNALAKTINDLYKAEVIHRRGPGRSFEAVDMRRSNGSTGSTTGGCWSPSAISHPPKQKTDTTPCWTTSRWPRSSNQMAFGTPGAVQAVHLHHHG